MRKFEKYRENLCVASNFDGSDYIWSYSTPVARIDYGKGTATVEKWYSVTTSKHINYACKQLGLIVEKI